MKLHLALLVLVPGFAIAQATAPARPASAARPAASAASARVMPAVPQDPANPAWRSPAMSQSPAEKAAGQVGMPGEIRGQQQVTPQLELTFKRDKENHISSERNMKTAPGGVDDAAARCLALQTPSERKACQDSAKAQSQPR